MSITVKESSLAICKCVVVPFMMNLSSNALCPATPLGIGIMGAKVSDSLPI